MGFNMGSIVKSVVNNSVISKNPLSLLNNKLPKTMNGLATNLVGGIVNKSLMNLLSMDSNECPSSKSNHRRRSGSDNDYCGGADFAIKSSLLSIGMSLAGPSIAQVGGVLGGVMSTGFGAVSNTLGSGLAAITAGISDATGLSSNIVGASLGVGTALALTGGNKTTVGVGMLQTATNVLVNSNKKQSKPITPANAFLTTVKSVMRR